MNKILRIVLIVVAVLVALYFGFKSYTKTKSPADVAKFDQNGLTVQVNYCRPYKKGREIFGKLLPYGQVWRTGANEATIFDVKQDVKIGDKTLKTGKYTLWTIPNVDKWTIIMNDETGQWGTNYDEKRDVLRVDVPVGKTAEMMEQFKIDFAAAEGGADMILHWENTEIKVPIRL
ncbi:MULTISPECIES: DUF2911 domain-containing protein [Emticicia]|uniref:DUF2911 domain-containing protein n=1 Tax=Emticicia TaxID=312278 RepID=UPI0007D8A10C|nr:MULTISPECIES: DUF2911 domain-containing protein [Emticicia]